jgi:hypothetical protein
MIKSIETCKRFSALTGWNTAYSNGNKVSPDSSPKVTPAEAVLKYVPQADLIAKDDLMKICQQNGIGKHLAPKLIAELVEDERLFECAAPRTSTRPKILLSRQPVTLPTHLTLDQLIQNSQGHYLIPAQTEPATKQL